MKWEVDGIWYEARLVEPRLQNGKVLKADSVWCESYSLDEIKMQSHGVSVYVIKKEALVKTKLCSTRIDLPEEW